MCRSEYRMLFWAKRRTRQQLNSVFYKMLNTENLVSYLVFTLILVIALFNVIGAIVMMIIDKKEHLKTLLSKVNNEINIMISGKNIWSYLDCEVISKLKKMRSM